jgi:hypothetical protein
MRYNIQTLTVFTRAVQILINNSVDPSVPPTIRFFEEKVAVDSDGSETSLGTDGSQLTATYDDSTRATSFDLLNPVDNSVVGSQTYEDLYASLYSLYHALAVERDQVIAENAELADVPAEEPPEEEPVTPPEDDGTVN